MKQTFLCFVLISLSVWSQEQLPMETKVPVGDSEITLFENRPEKLDSIIFLNVHEDELTSIEALFHYTREIENLHFFYLRHAKTRRIKFELNEKTYDFDPNRIFTRKGRKKTLKHGNGYSFKANKAVKKLAEAILARLPDNHVVVAMHNNTDENYSIKSYAEGGDEAQNTKRLYINPENDPDDFIYTTDETFFEAFESRKINVILQDNSGYVNDGSLSVYCGKNEIPYINIETQRGHFDAQIDLMRHVLEIIRNE